MICYVKDGEIRMMNWYLVLLFSFLGSVIKSTSRKRNVVNSTVEMDWDNEQICHWLTAVSLGEYVQVFRGMFVKLGITGKESSAFGGFAFHFSEGWGGASFQI
jgi:hypothetical protein